MKVIDLHRFNGYQHGKGTPVFSGRDKAKFYWEECGIVAGDDVLLILPDDLICLVGTFCCSLVCGLGNLTVEGPEHSVRSTLALKADHALRRIHDPEANRAWLRRLSGV